MTALKEEQIMERTKDKRTPNPSLEFGVPQGKNKPRDEVPPQEKAPVVSKNDCTDGQSTETSGADELVLRLLRIEL